MSVVTDESKSSEIARNHRQRISGRWGRGNAIFSARSLAPAIGLRVPKEPKVQRCNERLKLLIRKILVGFISVQVKSVRKRAF